MEPTWEDVQRKMDEMKIAGWSSLGNFSPKEHMQHLVEIETMRARKQRECQSDTTGPDLGPNDSGS